MDGHSPQNDAFLQNVLKNSKVGYKILFGERDKNLFHVN